MVINKVNELKVVLRVDRQHGQGQGQRQRQGQGQARSRVAPTASCSLSLSLHFSLLSAFGLATVWQRLA